MSEESPDAKLARVDERTISIEKKLDAFIDAHADQQKSQDQKIGQLEAHRNWLAGAGAAFAAIFGIHMGKH